MGADVLHIAPSFRTTLPPPESGYSVKEVGEIDPPSCGGRYIIDLLHTALSHVDQTVFASRIHIATTHEPIVWELAGGVCYQQSIVLCQVQDVRACLDAHIATRHAELWGVELLHGT
ncbi:MAG: hypothetical protein IPK32_08975 [Verrucomicrobiaceae bacterium]|nr:hypothetical protein [Verrucomicrobiaceae bacterium]